VPLSGRRKTAASRSLREKTRDDFLDMERLLCRKRAAFSDATVIYDGTPCGDIALLAFAVDGSDDPDAVNGEPRIGHVAVGYDEV
jgi:hypothetical protein